MLLISTKSQPIQDKRPITKLSTLLKRATKLVRKQSEMDTKLLRKSIKRLSTMSTKAMVMLSMMPTKLTTPRTQPPKTLSMMATTSPRMNTKRSSMNLKEVKATSHTK
jgi:hypothetical protein